MRLPGIIANKGDWLCAEGPHRQIVVSSRVRLARNLRERPFPGWAKKAERIEIVEEILRATESLDELSDRYSEYLQDLSPLEKNILVERHLISREHASKNAGSAVVMNTRQSLSLMINEEDHLRIQSIQPGLQIDEAYRLANETDNHLEERLDFAYHPVLGYLTACPSNVGTGMRASAMVHLPGLVLSDQINKIINSVNKIGLAVRGLHGEGTEAMGNLFQVSNQTTLGETEEEIMDRLDKVILQVIEHERHSRETLLQRKAVTLLDQIGRAFGILNYAHSITSKEALNMLSIIKLGIDLGLFPTPAMEAVDELFIETQPWHLQKNAQRPKLTPDERDVMRAEIIRTKLKKLPDPDISNVSVGEDPGSPANDE